ncbi:vWA domain-containing protein [Thioalkalivibrio sp. ALE11]|uniref:vWA domain-containing protein n=1 Tax=Thioalkalivibrio sp. ALE11 TaxID=1265494 RepID=UPI0009D95645|nr:vWA domain-containing protein [Thioalkalivibrio sp. ALE11]
MSNTIETTPDGIEGEASHRTLHFIWLVDWSYSMSGTKIQKVNWAIREVLPELQRIEDTERVRVKMRAIKFGDKAEWHIGPEPVAVEDFEWHDMDASGGITATAQAIDVLAEALRVENLGKRNVPPVCVLLSDGYCTDSEDHYQSAIDALNKSPWGAKAVRLSIGIAKNANDYNKEELDAFISPYLRKEGGVETLHADTPKKLVEFIRMASTVATVAASRSKESTDSNAGQMPVQISNEDLNPNSDLPDLDQIDASEEF